MWRHHTPSSATLERGLARYSVAPSLDLWGTYSRKRSGAVSHVLFMEGAQEGREKEAEVSCQESLFQGRVRPTGIHGIV